MLILFRRSCDRKLPPFAAQSSSSRRRAALRRRPLLEDLEGRQMLSTFTVTSAADSTATAMGTLRWAITQSNDADGPNTIDFKISNSGLQKIELQSPLPPITTSVNIDGLSQNTYVGDTSASPLIQIDGTDAGAGAVGLYILASGSSVSGLSITHFSDAGVALIDASNVDLSDLFVGLTETPSDIVVAGGNGTVGVSIDGGSGDQLSSSVVAAGSDVGVALVSTSGDTLTGDFIGTDTSGDQKTDSYTARLGNGGDGVWLSLADYNTVADSVIANNNEGVDLDGGWTYDNTVSDDFIGTNAGGTSAMPNGVGVIIQAGSNNNTIGGAMTNSTPNDVISGNDGDGVHIVGGSYDNVVEGDFIGTNGTGTASLANGESGVAIYGGSSGNLIGGLSGSVSGPMTGTGDVISGNDQNGVYISDSGTEHNQVEGDFIGTNADGAGPVPNGMGVYIQNDAEFNTIGGTTDGAPSDVISGNDDDGVHIVGGASYNLVAGDFIGTTVYGNVALGNGESGVALYGGAQYNIIGNNGSITGDVISGNGQNGVYISDSGTMGNSVDGDDIGTDYTSSYGLPNSTGVLIQNDAANNTIGGTSASERDVITGNSGNGVAIINGAIANTVDGDYIGLGLALTFGSTPDVGNGESGVAIYGGANNNMIGGTASGAGNVISGNDQNGVYISDSGTEHNQVEGDFIGTNAAGTLAVPNGTGVFIQNGASDNTIGGTTTYGTPNDVISGNLGDGVHIVNCAFDNTVEADYIGVDPDGNTALGNGESGVAIYAGAYNNTIGVNASGSGSGNVISGNGENGVYISDCGTTGNLVAGDDIGTDYTGSYALANNDGVVILNYASTNTIGGTTTAARDVISGNTSDGVDIANVANGNTVEGDYIGLNAAGTAGLGNGHENGVALYGGALDNLIGGATTAARDVISANGQNGVYISGSGTETNAVAGDYIGTDYTGFHAVPNDIGVNVTNGATSNYIGGTLAGATNVISGNNWDGVEVSWGAYATSVEGDDIGVGADGVSLLPNKASGVSLFDGADETTIGYDVIAFNAYNGVYIGNEGTNSNLVEYDSIYGNNEDGVLITNGASYETISYSTISNNGNNGVEVDANSTNNTIEDSTLDNNGASGVYIAVGASDNSVQYCTLDNNMWGLFDTGSNENDPDDTASGNTISNYVW